MGQPIAKSTLTGFKSIRALEAYELRPLNVRIGANGAGISNFVGFFSWMHELVEGRLELAANKLSSSRMQVVATKRSRAAGTQPTRARFRASM